MRKYHHRQLLDLVQSLSEANTEIRRLLLTADSSAVISLLAQCQESAVQMGEFIETLEGEGTRTVLLLEEYCEDLFQASLDVDKGAFGSKNIKHLQDKVTDIGSAVRNELVPNKIEVAFLPYKASMWDSLESIWRAAAEDPQCAAFVVPIPYYDMLPNGELGQMHDESGQYPDDVPVTDWQEYDIEARHPDVIFIHNPFDDNNRVTTIHPDFYSRRLKEHTEILAYVPYAISFKSLHSVGSSGALLADKVFVPAESLCRFYWQQWEDLAKEKPGQITHRARDKFVALGSPKFDAILGAKREDHPLPDEWKGFFPPYCEEKKVVLYDTSLAEILEDSKAFLIKLRFVLEQFRKDRRYLLIWRPHPLSWATFQSMRNEFADQYHDIIEEYRSAGYGIFDESPDLQRAILYSDAFFGTMSSVISLFFCVGKPAIMQSTSMLSAENGDGAQRYLERLLQGLEQENDLILHEGGDPEPRNAIEILDALYGNPDSFNALSSRQIQLFREFYASADGSAGARIWAHCKAQALI